MSWGLLQDQIKVKMALTHLLYEKGVGLQGKQGSYNMEKYLIFPKKKKASVVLHKPSSQNR